MSRTPSWSTPSGAVMAVVGSSPCTRHPSRDGNRGCHGPGGRRRCLSQRRPLCGHQRTHAMAGVMAVVAHVATLRVVVFRRSGGGFGRFQLPYLPWPPRFPHSRLVADVVRRSRGGLGRLQLPSPLWPPPSPHSQMVADAVRRGLGGCGRFPVPSPPWLPPSQPSLPTPRSATAGSCNANSERLLWLAS